MFCHFYFIVKPSRVLYHRYELHPCMLGPDFVLISDIDFTVLLVCFVKSTKLSLCAREQYSLYVKFRKKGKKINNKRRIHYDVTIL
jgi:hypothetical protein